MESSDASLTATFSTKSAYSIPSQKYMIPATWARFHLSQLVNKVLELPQPIPFDFFIKGELLRGSLAQWCIEKGVSTEENLEIEYVESSLPPQKLSSKEHEHWVSSISCQIPGYCLVSSYSGVAQLFTSSQELVHVVSGHTGPVISANWVHSQPLSDTQDIIVATASHDMTAQLTRLSTIDDAKESQVLASLHLHSAPLSSIAVSPSGTSLLSSSWDGVLGLWTTDIPEKDEVAQDDPNTRGSKRRRTGTNPTRRKGPAAVLKSHTGKVTQAAFITQQLGVSCGWDSTIRTWDLEEGVCTHTITASERPFTALCVFPRSGDQRVFATSTDRTLSLFDLKTQTATMHPQMSFTHPAMPSRVVSSPSDEWRVLTGAYDGIARIWDIRNLKSASTSFKAFEGMRNRGDGKILGVDWADGIVGVCGEGGHQLWRMNSGGMARIGEATKDRTRD